MSDWYVEPHPVDPIIAAAIARLEQLLGEEE